MHNRIYAVAKEVIGEVSDQVVIPDNIADDIFSLSEFSYYEDHFIGEIADYVGEDEDHEGSLEWLKRDLTAMTAGQHIQFHPLSIPKGNEAEDKPLIGLAFSIGPEFKKEYFRYNYGRFLEKLEHVKSFSLEDFSSTSSSFPMYELRSLYEDKFSHYVELYNTEYGTERMTLDGFVRSLEPGMMYYVGATLDYHW